MSGIEPKSGTTDPELVAEIDAIEEGIIEAGSGGGGSEPTGGPYKPTDDPIVEPMGGPYKPTSDPAETNGGPYKPTTDEPAAATT